MSNSSEYYENYFKRFYEFDISSEDEKILKCSKLLEDSKRIERLKEKDQYLYNYSLAELNYYKSKELSRKYNITDGILFKVQTILEDKNEEYLHRIIEYKEIAFKNYIKCNDYNKKLNPNENHDRITEGIRIISQELSIMYYIIDNNEKFFEYGQYDVEFNSLNAIYIFLKYYCDEQDYENAKVYYNLMHNYKSKRLNNYKQDTALKVRSYPIYYKFLYDSGMYKEALNVAKEFKKYVVTNELIENKLQITRPTNEKIEKCELLVNKSKEKYCNEDILLKYFDKEIVELMSDDNKVYILTSLNIYEYMKSVQMTMDYSATLMPILKVIENIMFEIMAKKYHNYIMKRYEKKQVNPRDIKVFIDQKNNTFIENIEQLELGSAIHLIGYKYYVTDELIIRKCFIDFCNENNMKNSREIITELYKELDELRNKRNHVAHKNRVFEESVQECYDILLNNIKFISFLYTNFRFVFEDNLKGKDIAE